MSFFGELRRRYAFRAGGSGLAGNGRTNVGRWKAMMRLSAFNDIR